MSIVLNLVSPDQSWIMSDGLAVNNRTHKKISDSVQKFEMLHPKLWIGYTGTYETAKAVVSNLRRLHPNLEKATVETSTACTLKILECLPKACGHAQFLITGLSNENIFITTTIKNDLSVEFLIPTKKIYRTAMLHNEESGHFEENIMRSMGMSLPLDEAIRFGMTKTVLEVSRRDRTVNQRVFFETIKR